MRDFSGLTTYLDSLPARGIPALSCVVWRNHNEIYRHVAGGAAGKELFWLFSCTKILTAAATAGLIAEGKLGLEDSVSDYLPAFSSVTVGGRPPVRPITIHHLLSMQSGMNYDLTAPPILQAVKRKNATTQSVVASMAEVPLSFDPGEDFQYSLSHDVLGAVIEIASGERFGDYLKRRFFEPLGMRETGFALPVEWEARLCPQYNFNDGDPISMSPLDNCYILCPGYESGGAGLYSSLSDYILLLDALTMRGEGKSGARVLPAGAIDTMRAYRLCEKGKRSFDLLNRRGYNYSLGVRVLTDKEKSGAKSSLSEFGWDGAAGAYALCDPETGISILYLQHVRACGLAYGEIHPTIRDLVFSACTT